MAARVITEFQYGWFAFTLKIALRMSGYGPPCAFTVSNEKCRHFVMQTALKARLSECSKGKVNVWSKNLHQITEQVKISIDWQTEGERK
jgi:hypothetical protein